MSQLSQHFPNTQLVNEQSSRNEPSITKQQHKQTWPIRVRSYSLANRLPIGSQIWQGLRREALFTFPISRFFSVFDNFVVTTTWRWQNSSFHLHIRIFKRPAHRHKHPLYGKYGIEQHRAVTTNYSGGDTILQKSVKTSSRETHKLHRVLQSRWVKLIRHIAQKIQPPAASSSNKTATPTPPITDRARVCSVEPCWSVNTATVRSAG